MPYMTTAAPTSFFLDVDIADAKAWAAAKF